MYYKYFNTYNHILTLLNTIKIIIICFNIPYFTTVVIVHSKFSLCSKIVSGNNHGWMVVCFIDWSSFNSEVMCKPFWPNNIKPFEWNEHIIM